MGQNNQKDQKGPKMTAAVMLVQNNQNSQKIWSPHISESAFFLGHPVYSVRWLGHHENRLYGFMRLRSKMLTGWSGLDTP